MQGVKWTGLLVCLASMPNSVTQVLKGQFWSYASFPACCLADEVLENKAHEPPVPVIIQNERPKLMKGGWRLGVTIIAPWLCGLLTSGLFLCCWLAICLDLSCGSITAPAARSLAPLTRSQCGMHFWYCRQAVQPAGPAAGGTAQVPLAACGAPPGQAAAAGAVDLRAARLIWVGCAPDGAPASGPAALQPLGSRSG